MSEVGRIRSKKWIVFIVPISVDVDVDVGE